MESGIILKAISGFYYVQVGEQIIECKARGRFRREKITPLVGDVAEISIAENGQGILEDIKPRKKRVHPSADRQFGSACDHSFRGHPHYRPVFD